MVTSTPAVRTPAQPANFTAEGMPAEWELGCAPPSVPVGRATAWCGLAADAGIPVVPQNAWEERSLEKFVDALRATHGAAGFDGWQGSELVDLSAHAHCD